MRKLSSFLAIALLGCAVESEPSEPVASDPSGVTDEVIERVTPRVMSELAGRGLAVDSSLVAHTHIKPVDGIEHVRYRQTYRGVPVVHGRVSVTLAGDQIAHLADTTIKDLDLDVSPTLTRDEVLARSLADFAHTGAEARAELVIDTDYRREVRRTRDASAPINADEVHKVPAKHVLVWQVLVGDHRDSMAYFYDAKTGELRDKHDPSSHNNITIQANTEYNGQVNINAVTGQGGSCGDLSLIDWKRGHSEFQNDNATLGWGLTTLAFGDGKAPTRDYSNLECETSMLGNGQTALGDAEFGHAVGWDMYKNVFNHPGWDGESQPTPVHSHWQETDSRYQVNVFGDYIELGDGDYRHGGTPHATVDIFTHEFTHGVDNHVGSLGDLSNGNVISEGIADVGGVLALLYKRNGFSSGAGVLVDSPVNDDWKLFGGIKFTGGDTRQRVLDRPSRDSTSSPDAWFNGIDDLNPHQSSGPLRRAMFFLMKGASTHDDWNHDFSFRSNTPLLPWGMKGVGVTKGSQIYFHTFFGCLDDADYANARSCAVTMATVLFPTDPSVADAVRNAFGGVNVGNVAATYPSAKPTLVPEIEQNGDAAHATQGAWRETPSGSGLEDVFKMDLFGSVIGTSDVDEFQFHAKCGRHIGALLTHPVLPNQAKATMRLFMLESDNIWHTVTPLSDPTAKDPTLSFDTTDVCTGTGEHQFIMKVFANGDSTTSPLPYIVHLDAE